MDLLEQELQRQRKTLTEETGGKKFFKRSEIEQKRRQKLHEEQKLKSNLKTPLQKSKSQTPNPPSSNPNSTPDSATDPTPSSSKTLTDEQKIDLLNLPKQEVIRRLRFLKQPVTLFGEDDDARLERLRYILKAGLFEVDDSDMTEGQTNDFLRDIVELKKRQKSGIVSRKRKPGEETGEDKDGGGGDDEMSGDGNSDGEHDKDLKRMRASFEDLCDEDKILVFFKKLLNEWNHELSEMGEAEKRSAKGKSMVATFKQCARYLHPLFKFCRKKVSLLFRNSVSLFDSLSDVH